MRYHSGRVRSGLLAQVGASALLMSAGLALPGAASAQQAPSGNPAGLQEPSPKPTLGTVASTAGQVQEVIVTATRRAEALRNVPVAVTALSGEQVKAAHIENFSDIPAIVPGATFVSTKGQSTANVQLRGQSTTNDAPALELPVAIFMDDIYYGSLASFDADFYDIAQIAVLRGPQGTTFGRNVVGGALQITSNKPKLGDTSGEINASVESFGNDPGFEANGYFNAPLSQDLAGRIAYSIKDVDGYTHNALTGHNLNDWKSWSIRPSLLWRPREDFTLTAFLNYTHEDDYAAGYVAYGQGGVVANQNNNFARDPWQVYLDTDGRNRRDIYAAQVRADWTQPIGTLSAITSYRALSSLYRDDGDSGPFPTNANSVNASREFQFSEELRLTSRSGGRLEYVTGLYYSFENLRKEIQFAFNGTLPNAFLSVLTKGQLQAQTAIGDAHVNSVAPFGEAKFHITSQIALTVGGRYTIEDKAGYTNHIGSSVFYGAAYNVNFNKSWTAFNPRVILDYKPRDGLLFYASYSTGFKGGGWSLTSASAAAAVVPLRPEDSTSYEIGAKTLFLDRRLAINIAAYQADTKNLQVRSLVGPVLTDTNAGSERVRGVEFESTFIPVRNAQLGLNYAYTDAYYASFKGCAAGGVDCTGNQVPFVPEHDLKIFAQYRVSLGNDGDLLFHIDDAWASKTQVSPLNNQQLAVPFTEKKGFLNASLTYDPPGGRWRAQLWAKNLLNNFVVAAPSNYYFYILTPAEYAAGLREVDRGVISPPRQVGATLTYRF